MWLRWWHPHALNRLEGVVQQGLQGPYELSPACLFHVLCFSSPHTTFSLWQRYGQSHFLKKLVVCKCALFPPYSHCLSMLPKLFPWTWQKLRRPPRSAQWGSPSQHVGNKMTCLWRPCEDRGRGWEGFSTAHILTVQHRAKELCVLSFCHFGSQTQGMAAFTFNWLPLLLEKQVAFYI